MIYIDENKKKQLYLNKIVIEEYSNFVDDEKSKFSKFWIESEKIETSRTFKRTNEFHISNSYDIFKDIEIIYEESLIINTLSLEVENSYQFETLTDPKYTKNRAEKWSCRFINIF